MKATTKKFGSDRKMKQFLSDLYQGAVKMEYKKIAKFADDESDLSEEVLIFTLFNGLVLGAFNYTNPEKSFYFGTTLHYSKRTLNF